MEAFSEKINSTTDFRINVDLNISRNASNNQSQIYDNSSYFASPMRVVLGITNLVFVFFGCLGNSLIIIVSIKANLKSTLKTTMIYFTALAISDIIVLVINALCQAVTGQLNSNTDLSLTHPVYCKITLWMGYSCVQVSSWILVVVTIERLICIVFPLKVKKNCYPKASKIIVSSIFIVIYGMNSHFLYGMHVQDGGLCYPLPGTYEYYAILVYPWVDFCVVFTVPFVTIVIGNSIIIYKLYKRSKTLGEVAHTHQGIRNKQISVTVMLVVVNVTFIICMTPWSLYNVVYMNNEHNWLDLNHVLLYDVLSTLINLNSVCNFYLYFLSGKLFRKEVKTLFTRLSCARNIQIAPVP